MKARLSSNENAVSLIKKKQLRQYRINTGLISKTKIAPTTFLKRQKSKEIYKKKFCKVLNSHMYIYQHVTVYFVCFFFLISQSIQKDKKKEIALIYNKFLEQNKLL